MCLIPSPENIQEVKLKKTLNGLGFSFFISELDTSLDCGSIVRIRTLFPGQPAEESGQIQEGDVILSINGQPLKASVAVFEDFSFRGAAGSLPSCSRCGENAQHPLYTSSDLLYLILYV
ncbi:hypothetical protein PO909_013325 [Leuciscus waleckii]